PASASQDRAPPRRRLPRALLGPHGPRPRHPPRLPDRDRETPVELPREDVLRYHHVRSADAAPDDRRVRRGARGARHRLPVRHVRDRPGRFHRKSPAALARRAGAHRRRQRGAPAEDPEETLMAKLRSLAALAALALFLAPAGHAQWVKRAPFPEPGEELLGASAGGKMYVFCGLAPGWKPIGMV